MAKRIIEVSLSPGGTHHEHIQSVVWQDDAGGRPYRESREDVAKKILAGERWYYTKEGGYTAEVEAYRRDGNYFIKTKGDTSKVDNLLSLVKK